MATEHTARVERIYGTDRAQARCSCGFFRSFTTVDKAKDQAEAHVERRTGHYTPVQEVRA